MSKEDNNYGSTGSTNTKKEDNKMQNSSVSTPSGVRIEPKPLPESGLGIQPSSTHSSIITPAERNETVKNAINESNKKAIEEIEKEKAALEARLANTFGGKSSIYANPQVTGNNNKKNASLPDISWQPPTPSRTIEVGKEVKDPGGLTGVFIKGIRKLPKGKAPADALANFVNGPGLASKAADKIRNLPGGDATLNVLSKVYRTVTSNPVIRTAKVAAAIVATVAIPVVGALSLAAVGYNIIKETYDAKKDRDIENEKKTLENIKENQQRQAELIAKNKKTIGTKSKKTEQLDPSGKSKESTVLNDFLDSKTPKLQPDNPPENKPYKANKLKATAKALGSSILEGASVVVKGLESASITGAIIAGASTLIGVGRNANSSVKLEEQRQDNLNQINSLKTTVKNYQNKEELKERERQELIRTKALEELIMTPDIEKKSKEELESKYNEIKEHIENKEFKPEIEKTGVKKAWSKTKEVAECVVQSQFGDVIAVVNENSREKEGNERRKKAEENEKTKIEADKRKKINFAEKEKADKVRQKLGQANQYKSSISPETMTPPPSPTSKHVETQKDHGGGRS